MCSTRTGRIGGPTPDDDWVDERLLGAWSADRRFDPGAPSDQILWFMNDGRGRLDWINWALVAVDYFSWREALPGVLQVSATRRVQWTQDGTRQEEPLPIFLNGERPYTSARRCVPTSRR